MLTEKLFDSDPYDTEFTAEVVSVKNGEAVLDRTLFFPEEGGQTCDRGFLEADGKRFEVEAVRIEDEVIYHKTEDGLKAGDKVRGRIDWAHRFDNMQNHTGEHIFSGIVHSMKGYDNVGFSLTGTTCQMDYNGKFTDKEISDIEAKANEVIWSAIPVECRYPSEEELAAIDYRSKKGLTGAVRIVTIPGVDVCACCAPHVKTTAEVGVLKVLSHLNYKGGTRLYIACGKRAYSEFVSDFDALTDIGHLFSTGRPDAAEAVRKLSDERQALRAELGEFEKAELFRQIDTTEDDTVFTKITDRNILNSAFNHFKEVHDGACYIFSEKGDGSYTFLAGGRDIDARTLLDGLKQKYNVRGGGKSDMIQGSATPL
ncbi:MAG: alanine--tRNA ligase-related protein [Candidatus Weimeria sp.]